MNTTWKERIKEELHSGERLVGVRRTTAPSPTLSHPCTTTFAVGVGSAVAFAAGEEQCLRLCFIHCSAASDQERKGTATEERNGDGGARVERLGCGRWGCGEGGMRRKRMRGEDVEKWRGLTGCAQST
ncbi:hypothetical protein Droror1_Dr00017572 [Drosera rotundifolia]